MATSVRNDQLPDSVPASAPTSRIPRDESNRIEVLRGLTCILIVLYHVVGDSIERGLHVGDDSGYRLFALMFGSTRMPMFAFLAGFAFMYKPPRLGTAFDFMRKKALRILVPMISVATLYFVLQQVTPDTNTKLPWRDIWKIYVFPYNHFWFLQAVFLAFLLMTLLEIRGALRTFGSYSMVFGIALALYFLPHAEPNIFSYQQALYLLPYFMAGAAACRFRAQLWNRRVATVMLAIFVVLFAYQLLGVFGIHVERPHERSIIATLLGLSTGFALLYWMPTIESLRRIGLFSFTIYLYHVFFTAGTRIALNQIGVDTLFVHFASGWIAGVVGPIAVDIVLRRYAFTRKVMLGQP